MTASKRDPLLTSARWLVIFCQGLALIVTGAVTLGIAVVLVAHDQVLAKLAEHAAGASGWEVLTAISLIMALVAFHGPCRFIRTRTLGWQSCHRASTLPGMMVRVLFEGVCQYRFTWSLPVPSLCNTST